MTFPPPEFNLKVLLEKLKGDELKSFKCQLWTLPEFRDDLQRPSSCDVQDADNMELADILTKKFPSNRLRHVTLNILEKISCTESFQTSGRETRHRSIIEKLSLFWRNRYCTKSFHVHDNMHRSQELMQFFNPKIATKSLSETVVLYGPAGVGKTTLAKKCLQEWTAGGQGGQIRCAFYLQCRELNHMEPCTFGKMICMDSPEWEDEIMEILTLTQEVLFVVDGFDELRVPVEALINELCGDWGTKHPAPILLSSLLKRKMLPHSMVLVTTQPQALRDLILLVEQPLFIEAEGFSEEERQAFFQRHFGDEKEAFRALSAVRANSALFHLASAPDVCWMICTCLALQEKGEDLAVTCQTCTSLFLKFLCTQFPPASDGDHTNGYGNSLEALCLLAAQSLWMQQSIFYGGELWRLGLNESDLCPFLDKGIIQRDWHCKDCYSFIHLSVQQFLAAMFYILKSEEGRDGAKWDIGVVQKLFSREVRYKNSNLAQAGLFLFGLLNEKRTQELETTFGCRTSVEVKQELLQLLQSKPLESKPFSVMDLREIFSYLYESQEEGLVKEAMASFEEMSLCLKTSTDFMHSSFCLKNCQCVEKLSLQVERGIFEETKVGLEACLQVLKHQNHSSSLFLWADLCSVICSNKNLSLLDISQSFLNEPSARILCDCLTSVSCCLQKVVIRDISPMTVYRDICLALIGKKTLTHLTLVGRVQESKTLLLLLLGEMMKHKKCNLQFLRLGSCSASIHQWDNLFLTLHINQSLTCLDLSDNKLLDAGAILLCTALKYPRCFLKRLSLENCHLTEASCKELSSALMVSQKLTHLSLARNDLGDTGLKILCEGLCYPECKLQMLVLQQCNITKVGCKHLSELLHGDCNLTHLDLGLNPIATGLLLLCDALGHSNFSLKCLGLWGCSLSPLYCHKLATALASNQKLETLDLGQNFLGKSGITMILETLKDSHGPLKRLRLKIDKSNRNIKKLLKDMKASNPSLTIDNVTRTTAPSYCDLFSEHPETILTTDYLRGRGI
ncbi:NACHT, LRR and PYD domains-containing protein 7 [Nannospalax galili]|uniref:NACHT, LRR and PYD domains-containing protein 7 n=1 Tax=Nannospalax galili TaxID=1026970 RepID=UPI000819E14B|nr:NACHT, LRR and PYD domains-containing protein 7 [Nannospalax galili]